MSEKSIQSNILLACSRDDTRLFRNNVGQAWQGRAIEITYRGARGQFIPNATPVRYGLCVGSSDLIGWRTVTITADMVGQRIALFAAVEVKHRAPTTEEQTRFIENVRVAGGLAGVARSEEEAQLILEGK